MPFTVVLPFFDPYKTALSGQAFRIHPIDDQRTETVAMGRYLQIVSLGDDRFLFSCRKDEFEKIWKGYFDLDRDYEGIVRSIDPEDFYLNEAAAFGRGIRILRQEPVETIISYIISQRRSIPSITTCVDRLCELRGAKIIPPALPEPFAAPLKDCYYAFPSVDALKTLTTEDLLGIGTGYRAPYIMSAINDISSGKLIPEAMAELSDDDLYKVLTSMYGVGKKVADCVMLFAFHRTGRFPIDVWMQRICDRYYDGLFDVSKYPGTAGIMQQFMFYYERNRKG